MAADAYVDEEYVTKHLGANFTEAIQRIQGVDLVQIIASATAMMQGYLRNSGYAVPTPSTDDELVKLGTLWPIRMALSMVPEASIPLPKDFDKLSEFITFKGILSGDLPLGLAPSQIGAVGAMKFSDSSADSSTGLPQRASRANLRGY